jgi:hypothetical protein
MGLVGPLYFYPDPLQYIQMRSRALLSESEPRARYVTKIPSGLSQESIQIS